MPSAAVAGGPPTRSLSLTEQGTVAGKPTDACLAFNECFWIYSGTATGTPFPTPVRVYGKIGGVSFDSIEACFFDATGTFRFFDRLGRVILEKEVSGQYCVTRPIGSHSQHTFTGTYTITEGSGRYAGASGEGTMTLRDNLDTKTFEAIEEGTITYLRPPPSD
jgi:hypothetical protein